MVGYGFPYRCVAVEQAHVIVGHGEPSRGVVVSHYAVQAHYDEASVAGVDEVDRRAAFRPVFLYSAALAARADFGYQLHVVGYPQAALPVDEELAGEGVSAVPVEPLVGGDVVGAGLDAEQSVPGCAYDDVAVGVFDNVLYPRLYPGGECIVPEAVVHGVVGHQSQFAAYPHAALAVGQYLGYVVAYKRRGVLVVEIVFEVVGEAVAVKFVQAVLRSYPYVAVLVLADAADEAAGKPVGGVQAAAVGLGHDGCEHADCRGHERAFHPAGIQ